MGWSMSDDNLPSICTHWGHFTNLETFHVHHEEDAKKLLLGQYDGFWPFPSPDVFMVFVLLALHFLQSSFDL